MPETFERLRSVVERTFPAAATVDVRRNTTSADIAGWDSLSHSILIMNVEEEFGVDLPLDAVFELDDLGELADLVDATSEPNGGK
jgi:acyl carrier protein